MSWCSGTSIFDAVVCDLMDLHDATIITDDEFKKVVETLTIALNEHDWYSECDSDYIDNVLVKEVFKKLNPDWVDDDED